MPRQPRGSVSFMWRASEVWAPSFYMVLDGYIGTPGYRNAVTCTLREPFMPRKT